MAHLPQVRIDDLRRDMSQAELTDSLREIFKAVEVRIDYISQMVPVCTFLQDFFQKLECEAEVQLRRMNSTMLKDMGGAELAMMQWLHYVSEKMLEERKLEEFDKEKAQSPQMQHPQFPQRQRQSQRRPSWESTMQEATRWEPLPTQEPRGSVSMPRTTTPNLGRDPQSTSQPPPPLQPAFAGAVHPAGLVPPPGATGTGSLGGSIVGPPKPQAHTSSRTSSQDIRPKMRMMRDGSQMKQALEPEPFAMLHENAAAYLEKREQTSKPPSPQGGSTSPGGRDSAGLSSNRATGSPAVVLGKRPAKVSVSPRLPGTSAVMKPPSPSTSPSIPIPTASQPVRHRNLIAQASMPLGAGTTPESSPAIAGHMPVARAAGFSPKRAFEGDYDAGARLSSVIAGAQTRPTPEQSVAVPRGMSSAAFNMAFSPKVRQTEPGGEATLVLGKGSWATALRSAVGLRREALKLLCTAGIVTNRELADDDTIVAAEHIDECVYIAGEMLKVRMEWSKEDATRVFEERFTALYQAKEAVVMRSAP